MSIVVPIVCRSAVAVACGPRGCTPSGAGAASAGLDPHLIVKLHTTPAIGGPGTFVLSVDYAKPVVYMASGHTQLVVTARVPR